jgi:hypothetical protein
MGHMQRDGTDAGALQRAQRERHVDREADCRPAGKILGYGAELLPGKVQAVFIPNGEYA